MKVKKFCTLFSLMILSLEIVIAQPTWVTNPTLSNLSPISFDLSFELSGTSNAYITVYKGDQSGLTSAQVKLYSSWGNAPPNRPYVNQLFGITGPQSLFIDGLAPNTTYTLLIVGESGGILQGSPFVIYPITTPTCPKIDILTGFSQPNSCITDGINVTFQVVLLDPPTSGILKGTQWTLDWGDGTPVTNYTSAADYEIPPLAMRQHSYTSITSCNYAFSFSVVNPCGESYSLQQVAVVHGRDIPDDGDGILSIVNNATGSSTIEVCQGVETIVTLRDNSTWNCQNPVLPGGLIPIPNSDPRNIEWLYGQDPLGGIENTITGTVKVGALDAPQSSGRISPSPYGPNSLSEAITIPATALPGEYFRVYLKNWNKCNWNDPDYVSTYVDIEVVASPDAPTAPSRIVCPDDDKTLEVTSVPVGDITWYSDAALTTIVGTGLTYTPTETAPGSYDYYVTDKESSGLLCESPATTVTLQIDPKPNTPTIDGPKKNDICYPYDTYVITADVTGGAPISGYQWFRNDTLLPGRIYDTIIISQVRESGFYTACAVGVAPSYCFSDPSDSLRVTVHTLVNVVQPRDTTICQGGTAIFKVSTIEEIAGFKWEYSSDGGTKWFVVGSSAPYTGFDDSVLVVTNPPVSYNGYLYHVHMYTPSGQGGCDFISDPAMLTINTLPTASPGDPIALCTPTPFDPIYMVGATAGGSVATVVWSGGETMGTWTQNTNPALAYFTPSVTNGSFTATLTVTGTAACGSVIASGTRTVAWSQTPTAEAGADISRCDMGPLAPIAMTGALAGGTYSNVNWTGGTGLGIWTQNADPALAIFTPTVKQGSFTATLTVSGSEQCVGTNPADTRIISWGETPVAEAGDPLSRCDLSPLAPFTMTGAMASGTYGTQTWSGGEPLGTWTQNADPALATFTPSVTSGSFVATLTLTGNYGCTGTNVSDTRTIEWSHEATVNAGPDQSICALGTVQLAGTIGGGATSATWSGGLGTYNPDNQTLDAIYTPHADERAANTATLTLTTNDPDGNCIAVSDDITIEIGTPITAATLTTSGDGCSGVTSSWLNVDITGGAPPYTVYYKVNGGVTKTIPGYISGTNYDLGMLAIGPYQYDVLRITDICLNDFTLAPVISESFTIYQQPVANAGSDKGVCNTFDVSLTAIPSIGTGTWTMVNGPVGGTIDFTPDIHNPSVTATANMYGAFIIRWTEVNAVCSDFADITVAYEKLSASGSSQNLCGTLSAILDGNTPAAGTGTWTLISGPGTVSFSPNANTPTATATASQYGTYVLRWTIANGIFCSTSSDVTITYEKAANAGTDQHLCDTYTATLAANTAAVGMGTWSLVSGPGTVIFSDVNAPGATATVTDYGSYVFRWTLDNGGFCNTSDEVTVVYNPAGQVEQPSDQVLCNGDNTLDIIFTTTNVGGTTTYEWTNSAAGIGLAASGSGNILSFPAGNAGTAPLIATIEVTPTYSDGVVFCVGTSKSFTITVNPTAQVDKPSDMVACNDELTALLTFTTANTVGTTSYAWSNSDPGIGLAASGTGNLPSFTAVNTTTSPVTATVTVAPTFSYDGKDCTGPSETFNITVNPTGQVTQPVNMTICNNGTGEVTFETVNLVGTTTYEWTNTDPGIGLAASGTGNISFTGVNAGTAPVTATIEVTPTFSYLGTDCPGDPKTFTITVNPTAQVDQPADADVCNGQTVNIPFTTQNTVGLTTYMWTNSNTAIGLGTDGTGPLSFIATNPNTYPISATITVTPTFNYGGKDCPGPSKNFTIIVNPTPSLTSSLTPPDICSSTLFSYTPSSLTAGTTFSWTRAVVAGITPAGPTSGTDNPNETLRNVTNIPIGVTYQYTLSANGCDNVQNVVVNIKPEPVIVPGQTYDICSGNTTNYHIVLDNFINPADEVTFTWPAPVLSPSDPAFTGGTARVSPSYMNIADDFINTMGVSGTATYTVTPYKNGCAGQPEDIIMTIRSQPVLDGGLDDIVCSNTPTGLTLAVAAGSVSADSYNILSRTLDAGLSAVSVAPVAATGVSAGYLSNDVFLNITGVDKNVTYSVQPVHGADCFGTPADVVITIRPQPYIVPAQTLTVCSGIAIGKEILLSPANDPAGTLFNWPVPTISNGSIQGSTGTNVAADPAGTLHINDVIDNLTGLPITATYNITPVSSEGCTGTMVPVVITINPEPVPKPINGRDKICINEEDIVYNVPSTAGSTYHWTLDPAIGIKTFDFNTNAIIIDAAAVPGSGNITIYETNSYGCDGDLSTLPVEVYTQAVPEDITGETDVCANSTKVYSVTSRAGSVYTWSIPGGAAIVGDPSAASVTVIFSNVGGTISVRETNIAGCITDHNPLTVTVRPLPTAILSGGGTMCDGGSMSLFVDFAGTAPFEFTYAINGASQPPVSTSDDPYTLNVTAAGTYTIVNVTDATGCTNTGFGSAVVSYYTKPTGVISGDATVCGGVSTTLTMSFTGTAPYTFVYTDGTTPLTVPNWPGAVYTVSVSPLTTTTYTLVSLTDGNTCSGALSGSAVVTVNSPPVLSLVGTNLTCYNDNTGAVDLTATGNSPFGFAWTGPSGFVANTEDISGLKAGTYNVTVTDTKGCISTDGITLTEPGEVDATLANTNIYCYGAGDGTITISAPSGGSGTYEYTINGGTDWYPSGDFSGLDPGTYDVRIRDVLAPVCNKILDSALELTGPAELNANVSKTDIICYGSANGSIIISSPTGGFGTYQYSINGGTTWQGSGNFYNLSAGFYDVRIRDAAYISCERILNASLEITELPELTATLNSTNVTCFGATDGTISITGAAGGSGTFEYSINGGGSWQPSGLYTSVTPGTYNVQLRDAVNTSCYKVLNPTLTITQPDVLKATVSSTMVSCNGADDGTITVSAPSGGSGSYEYTAYGTIGWQVSGSFTGLAPGSYDVRIRDALNTSCEITLNSGLDITEPPALSATVIKTDITCFGASDGTITITNSLGGYGTYEYSINGGVAWQSSNSFTGLSSGTYNVLMRDKTRTTCMLSLNPGLVITEPAVLGAILAGTDVTCFNANDGTITISLATGGSGSYQYTINGGISWQGTGSFINLAPSSYDVRIRDAVNPACELILNAAFVINEPPALSATLTKTNITCYGANDGTITVNGAAGGLGTYDYTVDGGLTWQASNSFTGLGPGYYNVKVRDAVNTGCVYTVNNSLNVIEPSILNASVSKTNVTCNGVSDGTITISSPTGGYGTYEFSIDGGTSWQASGSFTALGPATYNLMIRDAVYTGCEITLNPALTITEPAALTASMTYTHITCFGVNNGTIIISGAAGGYGTYEYSIDGGTTWAVNGTFYNLAPSTYNVVMRDAISTGCILTLNGALTITQPPALSASMAKTDITCFGASDGSIIISSPSGGYGTYEYTINGGGSWQASGSYTGLGPGTYNVQMRDAAQTSCVLVLNSSVSVTQPAILSAVVTPAMVTCNGADDGIINITGASGGYGTYEYTIDGFTWSGTSLYTGLAPGTYDVRIRDAANLSCEMTLNGTLQITEPAVLDAGISYTDISCNGANDGTITITGATGGYGTYDYTITGDAGWQASPGFTNLGPGTYDVRIRDKANTACYKILNGALVINEPALLAATVNSTDITCNGAANGTITITGASGGYGTYEYSIDGGVTWQTTGNFTGLGSGTYNVRIRDAAHITCYIILDPALTITQPDALSATVASSHITCAGADDGTITISSPLGGYGTYEYSVDGGTTWQASGSFTGLEPAFYNVQIRDAVYTSCTTILNSSLKLTEPGTLGATVVKNDITCNGADDGKITISLPTGGYGTYEYSIDGGITWQASGNFTDLIANTYNVQMRDAAHIGCIAILNAALTITEPDALTASVTGTDASCNGANDGTITISGAAGGYGSYQYTVDGGSTWFSSGSFTGLAPATYNVRMRDAVNPLCITDLDPALVISEPPALSALLSSTNVTCAGGGDGSITISSPAGGYGTYEYSINGGGSWQASGSYTGLVPGSYNVQMRDAAHTGCVKVLNSSLIITQPAILSAVVTNTMVTCKDADDGTITVSSPSGGTGSYEYTVNGGTDWYGSGSFTNLAPAVYNVQIRDAANTGCVITLNGSLAITEPEVLNAAVSVTNVTCNGADDGTISITGATGGYGTYEYSTDGVTWQGTGLFSGLAPATYNVQIRDMAHPLCIKLFTPVTITEPDVLTATVTSTDVTCNSANDGTITVSGAAGGYGTYGYSVNGGISWQGSGNFANLAPGTYDVRIRDAANPACEALLDPALTITEPVVLSAALSSTNVTCFGADDGTISIASPAGGYGTYQYTVDGGTSWQNTGSFTSLEPGYYNVKIRDAAHTGCVVTLNSSLRITEPSILAAFVTKTNVTCNGSDDGTISVSGASGGYGTYEYTVNGGLTWQSSGTFTSLAPDSYNVQIRDAMNTGCVIVLNSALSITEPALLNATITQEMITCTGADDGRIIISGASGGSGSYLYSVDGGTSWQGSGTFTNLAPGNYDVRISDAASPACVVTLNPAVVISEPPALSALLSATNVTCFGGDDGTITISSPAGGYGTYEYSINGGGSWQASGSFTDLTMGSYNILMRDAAHITCMKVLNSAYLITQPGMLSATVSKTDVSCNGANNGTVSITSPSGGYGTYEYSITGGTSWQATGNYTGLTPGTYDVRMRDAAHTGCTQILYPNLVIGEPLVLSMTSTGDIVLNCNGDTNGAGTFYASGGTMPYSFTVVSNTTGATIPASGFNSQSFNGAGAGTITVRVTDANGCTAQATITITQPAVLTPGSVGSDQVICSGQDPAQLTGVTAPTGGPGSYTYQWQYSSTSTGLFINIADATSSQYTPPSGATSTLYYRRMVSSGICTPVYSNVVEIKVNPLPIAVLSGGETICPGESSEIKVDLSAGTGLFEMDIENYPGLTYTGYTSGADITVTPAATTTYKLLRVKDANGCEVVSPSANMYGSATVTVRDLPAITSSPEDKTTCEFGMVTFNVTATGSDLTYQWYVDMGSGFVPLTDAGIYYGTATSSLMLFGTTRLMDGFKYHVVVSGCSVSVTSADATLTVNTIPEITRQPHDTTVCMNAGGAFEVEAQGTAITYQWELNTGSGFTDLVDDAYFSGAVTPTLTVANAQGSFNNYMFRMRVTGICGAPAYSNIVVLHVNIAPTVTVNPVDKAVCDNAGTAAFTGGGTGPIDSLRWQAYSGGVWTDIYDGAIYSGTMSQQLTITNAPLAYDGNRYRLALKAACIDAYTSEAVLTVNENPVVDFSALDPVDLCGAVPLVIDGNPTGGSGTYTQHTWTGDVGPLDEYFIQAPTFTSVIGGSFNLNYKVKDSNGCMASDSIRVDVDAPDATFMADISGGCTPLTVSFTKAATGEAKFWWDFDDGSPLDSVNADPSHIFTNTTGQSIEYRDVELKVMSAGGCYDTYSTTITVYPEIVATITPSDTVVCSGSSLTFSATPGASKYFWEYGDGVSGYGTNTVTHMYTNMTTEPVTMQVKLTTTSVYNCFNVQTINITVVPMPVPQFQAVPVTQIYDPAGNEVAFTNNTNDGTWNWQWTFGDGGTGNTENPVHTYTDVGDFDVELIVSNTYCSDSTMSTISVTPQPPVADFDSIASGCTPLEIQFNNTSLNLSTPGTTIYWDFGDGGASTTKDPAYVYTAPGIYRITLTVTGPGGTSKKEQIVEAYQTPEPYFQVSPSYVFANDEAVRCFNLSSYADYYIWEFGDGDTSHIDDPFHVYMEEGIYDITLHAYSTNGCYDAWTLAPAVTVDPAGELRFSTVFQPNKEGPIEMDHLPTGGDEMDMFFFPPIREKIIGYKMQIFNRLGVLIFETRDINIPWNGYYKGELCPQGVYVWYVEGKYANGEPFRKAGDITLLH